MVITNGNNIVGAFTNGVEVQAIYNYGVKVWPTTEPSLYYFSWLPTTGWDDQYFTVGSNSYYFSDYNGYFDQDQELSSNLKCKKTQITAVETNATRIGWATFSGCWRLSQASLSKCSFIGDYVFDGCWTLTNVYLPICEFVGDYAFNGCTALPSIDLPLCKSISYWVFNGCYSLSQINIPKCEYIDHTAFRSCSSLQSIDLPVCSYIGTEAFLNCTSLSQVILRSNSVCQLGGSRTFSNADSAMVYVPTSLVDAYKSADYWSSMSSRIFPIQ